MWKKETGIRKTVEYMTARERERFFRGRKVIRKGDPL